MDRENIKLKPEEIIKALKKNKCSVLSVGVLNKNVGNSVVLAMQWFHVKKIFNEKPWKKSKIGLTHLVIDGPMPKEPLHTHISHIIGMITYGKGKLCSKNIKKPLSVKKGDIVIIPKNIGHSFDASLGQQLHYAAIIIGDEIDYQRHHFGDKNE